MEQRQQPPILINYASPNGPQVRRVLNLLTVWVILDLIAVPFGLLIAIGGCYFAYGKIEGAWAWDDKLALVVWCANLPGLITAPLIWASQCWKCIERIERGQTHGMLHGQHLCFWALVIGAVFASGLFFGLGKAVSHRRWHELPWWLGGLILAFGYAIAVEFTRRTLLKAKKAVPMIASTP